MLRHATFAAVTLLACSVASAQYPVAPFGSYGGTRPTPAFRPAGSNYGAGYSGIRAGGCVGGNCPTGSYSNRGPNGNCSQGSLNPFLPRFPTAGAWAPTGLWRNGGIVPNTAYRGLPYGSPVNHNPYYRSGILY